MSYKTITVHVDDSKTMGERAKLATALAALEPDAHIVGAAVTGVSDLIYDVLAGGEAAGNVAPVIDEEIKTMRARARRLLANFEGMMQSAMAPSWELRVVDDESLGGMSLQARYSDIVLLGKSDPDEAPQDQVSEFPEYVAMTSGRPVLMLPQAGHFDVLGKPMVLAWDASLEATRTVHHALPLLRRASKVHVLVFNVSRESGLHGDEPGADIALYLARHGIEVEVHQETTKIDLGNALLSTCADLEAELLVMGCYGHSRFRELMIGGVSRTVFRSMTLPVLFAH